jgi:hypothetical protein
MGVRSMRSVKAYARDILTWLRFLKERRGAKTVWQADREDVATYYAARRVLSTWKKTCVRNTVLAWAAAKAFKPS